MLPPSIAAKPPEGLRREVRPGKAPRQLALNPRNHKLCKKGKSLPIKPTRSLVCGLAIAIGLASTGTAQAQATGVPPQPDRNPLRVAKARGAETQPTLPGDAPTVAWSEQEVAAARADCAEILADLAVDYESLPPLKEGACGAPAPILLKSIGTAPKVVIDPPATVTCKLARALSVWLDRMVQPEAKACLGSPVVKLANASSYVCRNRYNGTDTPLSEHGLANALDVSEFVFQSGQKLTVLASWPRVMVADAPPDPLPNPVRVPASPEITGSTARVERMAGLTAMATDAKSNPFVLPRANAKTNPFVLPAAAPKVPLSKPPAEATPPETETASERKTKFVTKVHRDACNAFGTVLGPNSNDAHKDHFHLDMKARRHKAICE